MFSVEVRDVFEEMKIAGVGRRGVGCFLKVTGWAVAGLLLSAPVFAVSPSETAPIDTSAHISYEVSTQSFRIDAGYSSYVIGVDSNHELQTLYWGARLRPDDQLPAAQLPRSGSSFDVGAPGEFTGWGGMMYVVPDLKITFPDGNRDLVLNYQSYAIADGTLTLTMKDIERDVVVELYYRPDPETGVLARWAKVENKTGKPFTIEQLFAGTWDLPADDHYQLTYLTGRWADEWHVENESVHPGKVVLESRRGSTSDRVNPWFAIERGAHPDQDNGEVWFGALGWSGSWQINIEQDSYHAVRVTGGFTPFDFAYELKPGESLATPKFYGGYSGHGIGGASRLLHRFELGSIVPQAPHPKIRPILYDSWEATGFDVTEANQEALAEKAASIGVQRFVIDDGWFGARNSDHAGLGDWFVNKQKFPNGLKPLIDKVHSLGMDFGIWVEPEMVNPDSDLYRKHPDWVLYFNGRPRTLGRNQLVLNLARPDVRAYVYGFLNKLLNENDIAFLKWDYNRNWAEPGWPSAPLPEQKEVYVKYVRNLYGILAELRKNHPNVEIEDCSGGGARVDLGILRYTDEVWPSDNTDPFDRLSIQNGFTYAYAPGLMMSWVTDSPNWVNNRTTSVEYRFLSSMQGSLGVGANLNKWTPEELTTAKKMIAQYKEIRATVQHGALYRLVSPLNGSEQSVTESVSEDKNQAVLFAFLHSSQENQTYPTVYPRALDPDATYTLQAMDGKLALDTPSAESGDYWMHHGVNILLRGDFQASLLRFNRSAATAAGHHKFPAIL
jgi:alpha-galactosidase